jgi:D-alanyl-D-alanine carboxypeptidase/D-alanyl-D-alanine-endopeptidase (penicillin-binding protein 4)
LARLLSILLLLALSAHGQSLAGRIQRAIDRQPETKRSNWGIRVVSLKTGRVLYQRNADKYFTPASNTKLYSTALALLRLGPDHKFATTVRAPGEAVGGEIRGDVSLVGGGDPTMSWRKYPYEKGSVQERSLAGIESLADEIAAKGIRRITGNIVGDDTAWPWDPYPSGWAIDDTTWSYGAPVSALMMNENTIELRIRPAEAEGQLARISIAPALEYYWIDNRVLTQAGRRTIRVEREGRLVRVSGQLSAGGGERTENLAIDDPALYAAHALHEALSRRGVSIGGVAEARHRLPEEPWMPVSGVELARRESRPLAEIIQVTNKVSQNQMADMLLRAAADGTVKGGVEQLELLLSSIGVDLEDYSFRDGSGMSRLNLTSPKATIELLKHMWASPLRAVWLTSLPVGGVDGTLESRFEGKPRGKLVQAKTGSLSHVNALSGYIQSRTHGMVAFSIMVNGSNGPSSVIRQAIDTICLEIAR